MFPSDDQTTDKLQKFSYQTELIVAKTSEALLAKPEIVQVLQKMKLLINQPDGHYQFLYQSVLDNVAQLVQCLPSYKNKTYNGLGGLLGLAVNRAYMVLAQYRQQFPVNRIQPDKMPNRLSLWSYALFTAGLFYNIGYIATNFYVSACDSRGHDSKVWNPMQTTLDTLGTHYRYSFQNTNHDELAGRYTILIAQHLMPAEGLAWIASDQEVMEYWLAILQDDERSGGLFATQIMQAEEALLLQDLAMLQMLGIPPLHEHPLQHEHKKGERKSGGFFGKDMPEGKETQRSATHDQAGMPKHKFSAGVQITDRDITGGQVQELGERFIAWLKNGVEGGTISVNRQKSFAHMVNKGLLLIQPEAFQAFVKANGQLGATAAQVEASLNKQGVTITQVSRIQTHSGGGQAASRFGLAQGGQATQGGVVIDPTTVFNQTALPDSNPDIKNIPISVPPNIPAQTVTNAPSRK